MALPIFIAGVAVGGLGVVALKNKAKIAEELKGGVEKVRKFAEDSLQKTKEPRKNANGKHREKPKAQEEQDATDN